MPQVVRKSDVNSEADREDDRLAESAIGRPRRTRLSKSIINFWLDAALFAAVLVVVWISAMLQVVFPAPTIADGWSLWGLSFDQWRDLQFGALCVATACAVEHIVLHWNWICSIVATKIIRAQKRPDEGVQAIYGVGTFITVLAVVLGSLAAAMLTVSRPAY